MTDKTFRDNYNKLKKEVKKEKPNVVIKITIPYDERMKIAGYTKRTKSIEAYIDLGEGKIYTKPVKKRPVVKIYQYGIKYCKAKYYEKEDIIIISIWNLARNYEEIQKKIVDNLINQIYDIDFDCLKFYTCIGISRDKKIMQKRVKYDFSKLSKETFLEDYCEGCKWGYRGEWHNLVTFVDFCKTDGMEDAMRGMFKVGLISGGKYIAFSKGEAISQFLCAKNHEINHEKKSQKEIDELCKKVKSTPKIISNEKDIICVAQSLEDDIKVLRWFYNVGEIIEITRLFIKKDKLCFCRKIENGEFAVSTNRLSANSFAAKKIIFDGEHIFENTKLKYFEDVYKEFPEDKQSSALFIFLRYPFFERMYKAGYKNICMEYFNQTHYISWDGFLKAVIGKVSDNKSLYKALGFNKYQIEFINNNFKKIIAENWKLSYGYGLGANIKTVFNLDDCSDIDNETFDFIVKKIIKAAIDVDWYWSVINGLDILGRISKNYSIKAMTKVASNYEILFKNITSAMWGREALNTKAIFVYRDYIDMIIQMDACNTIKPYFDDLKDLVRKHDNVVEIFNVKKYTYQAEAFQKSAKKNVKWEYSENEIFEVIAPKKPEELAKEGNELRHCVGSYIQKVINGTTNIMFIRKKEEPEKSFFTVEITNDNMIQQVHGFANRNADTEPGLEEFIKEWAKARKLKVNNYNKIR